MKNSIKREQSQIGLNSAERENFRTSCKKYVFVLNAIELLKQLVDGKRVEGVLYMDQDTGKLTFKAYNRKPQIKRKDVLVKKLPWGWIKESLERIKVFGSFPKDFCTAQIIELLNEHNQDAKNALIDRESIDFV